MTTSPVAPNEVSSSVVMRRALVAEWTRLWTLRSTWWSLLAGTGLMVLVAAAAGASHDGVEPAPIWAPGQIAIVPAQFAFLLVVLLAVTGEYSTGSIRSSLQWMPRRGILLAARSVVPVVFVAAWSIGAAAVSTLITWAFVGPAAEVVPADVAASLGRVGLVVAFGGVLGAGLGLLLRSTAGTLTAIFLLILALPLALGNTGVGVLTALSDGLPGRAIVSVVVIDEVELTTARIAAVMIAWSTFALVAGGWSLLRRDTT